MLDEASQIIVYSHRLEQKSQELERATQELRAANERLTELDRLKDDFVSTVSHELRTPLTSIRAFSEILHDNPDLAVAERTRFLNIVIKETERLTRLINQILDVSKLESGRAEWHESLIDLREDADPLKLGIGVFAAQRPEVEATMVVAAYEPPRLLGVCAAEGSCGQTDQRHVPPLTACPDPLPLEQTCVRRADGGVGLVDEAERHFIEDRGEHE